MCRKKIKKQNQRRTRKVGEGRGRRTYLSLAVTISGRIFVPVKKSSRKRRKEGTEKSNGLGISRGCFQSWNGHLEMTRVRAMDIKPAVREEKPSMGKKREPAKRLKDGSGEESGKRMGDTDGERL